MTLGLCPPSGLKAPCFLVARLLPLSTSFYTSYSVPVLVGGIWQGQR